MSGIGGLSWIGVWIERARTNPTIILVRRMLIPKKNRKEVYEYLFHQGVLVAKKDFNLPKHPALNVPNLEVI